MYLTIPQKQAVCLEIGFLTNEIDLQKLTDDTYLEKMAFQIYLGILNYIEESRQI